METEQGTATELPTIPQERVDANLAAVRQRFQDLAAKTPDDPFVLANTHMRDLSSQTWSSAGLLSMTGAVWWALNLSCDVAYPHTVIFNAKGGPDWDFAVFTSSVAGYWLKDPSTLHGDAQFQLEAVAAVDGEVSINLYDMNWGQIGSFLGVVLGVSVSKVAGKGTIKYK